MINVLYSFERGSELEYNLPYLYVSRSAIATNNQLSEKRDQLYILVLQDVCDFSQTYSAMKSFQAFTRTNTSLVSILFIFCKIHFVFFFF